MNNLYLINEYFLNNFNDIFLNLLSLTAILAGLAVIVSKNPVISVLFLIGLFLTIAGYLMMLGLNFIGLSYLLVYVGAVSILFLFILMLINVRVSELLSETTNSLFLAILIGIVLNSIVYFNIILWINDSIDITIIMDKIFINKNVLFNISLVSYTDLTSNFNSYFNEYLNNISYVTSNLWDGSLAETTHITSLGNVLYTVYPLWLIITSLILLLAMVGAIVITIKQKS